MPGYIMHLSEAEIISSILFKSRKIEISDYQNWKKLFLYGVLLPDAVKKEQKKKSHFWKMGDFEKVVMVPDLSLFLEKYGNQLYNPMLYGCFAHLHLDMLFFKEFFSENISFLAQNGKEEEQLINVRSVLIKKNNHIVSLEQFFSESFLYGDYTKLNRELILRYGLKVPTYYPEVVDQCADFFEEADFRDLKEVLDKLSHYITLGEEEDKELKVFSYNSVIEFLEKAAGQFCLMG